MGIMTIYMLRLYKSEETKLPSQYDHLVGGLIRYQSPYLTEYYSTKEGAEQRLRQIQEAVKLIGEAPRGALIEPVEVFEDVK